MRAMGRVLVTAHYLPPSVNSFDNGKTTKPLTDEAVVEMGLIELILASVFRRSKQLGVLLSCQPQNSVIVHV